jgi:hypothetical protein
VVNLLQQNPSPGAVSVPLTAQERVRRGQLILTVEKGLSNFLAVGAALLELRSSRLYRETHDTFESFCREVFGLARSSCDGLIRSTQTAELLMANGAKLPEGISEATVRPVASLPAALQPVSWQLIEAVSPKCGPTQPVVAKVCRVIKNAIELNGSSGNGHKPRKKEHTERETPFLRPVIRLVNWPNFSASLVVSHIEKLPSAMTSYTACERMIERCESVRNALAERFPELCQPTH